MVSAAELWRGWGWELPEPVPAALCRIWIQSDLELLAGSRSAIPNSDPDPELKRIFRLYINVQLF